MIALKEKQPVDEARSAEISRFAEVLRERSSAKVDTGDQDRKIARRLCYRLTSELTGDLAGKVLILFDRIERFTLEGWSQSVDEEAVLFLCTEEGADPVPPKLGQTMDVAAIRDLTTLMMGGERRAAGSEGADKPLTSIERSIGAMAAEHFSKIISRQTGNPLPHPTIKTRSEVSQPEIAQTKFVALTCRMQIGGHETALQIAMSEPDFGALALSRPPSGVRSETKPAEPPTVQEERAREVSPAPAPKPHMRFSNLPLQLELHMDAGTQTLGTIHDLNVGDVLTLPAQAFGKCSVQVAGRSILAGELGQRDDHLCIRIETAIS